MRTYTVRLNVILPSAADESWTISEAIYERLVTLATEADLAGSADDPYFTYWLTLFADSPVAAVTAAAERLRAAAGSVIRGDDFEIVSLEVQAADTDDRALSSA